MVDRSDIPHRDWDPSFERNSGSRRSLVSRTAVASVRADVVSHRLHFCRRDLVLQSGLAERIHYPPVVRRFTPMYSTPTRFITPALQPLPDSRSLEIW